MLPAELLRTAAVIGNKSVEADRLIEDFVSLLKEKGWRVHGLRQSAYSCTQSCSRNIDLYDMGSLEKYRISQNLGPESESCCVDAQGIAEASVVLRRALAERADLVVPNRFGRLEAEGSGLRDEFLALIAEGIPVLTVVAERHLPQWQEFTGELSVILEPHLEALQSWFASTRQSESVLW